MGRAKREKPLRLPEKLLQIRNSLGYSQREMLNKLNLKVVKTAISDFERGTREPSLLVILAYARLAGISTDYLLDDGLELLEN